MQQTILFMCRDLLSDVEDVNEFRSANVQLDQLIDAAVSLESYDPQIVAQLERLLARYATSAYALFSRNFDDPFLDALLKRILSLKEMCTNLLQ